MARDIRAALAAGIRPSVLVFNEQPGDWSDADRRLLRAYQTLQDESCSHCGNPVWLCRSGKVEWSVAQSTCNADRALEVWREAQDKAGRKPKPGSHPYPDPYVIRFDADGTAYEDRESLPSREEYFRVE